MGCELIIIGLVISVFVLALVGFVTVIRALIPKPKLRLDYDATRRVMEELNANQVLTPAAYAEIIAAIEQAQPARESSYDFPTSSHEQPSASDPQSNEPILDKGLLTALGEKTVADRKDRSGPFSGAQNAIPPIVRETVSTDAESEGPVASAAASPWDLPDSEPAEPTRSWREVFALFMQEKNIRWGELASGILIVCSAVGLVLSLRNQLLEVIPYFPALLFLLITAAIIASGVYTLRRWRLQMTSRGILVIGLLLIPLNVLIGCWLTGNRQFQRPLDDPVYWIAIVVELASLSLLTWLAAKHLLRAYFWGLMASVMGSAAYTLVINRIPDPSPSILRTALWMSPLAVFFFVAASGIAPRMNQRSWNGREIRRLLANLGISFFAVAVGISLFFIKWRSPSLAIALMPVLIAVSITTIWLGSLIVARQRMPNEIWRLTAQSLIVLGALLSAGGIVVSQSHPTLGFTAALLASLMFIGQCFVSRSAWMSLPAMVCIAGAAAAGTRLFSGLANESLAFDQQTSPAAFFRALVSGRTGISLFLAVGAMALASRFWSERLAGSTDPRFRSLRFIVLLGIAVFGVLLAIVASFLNPQNRFDVFTATILLGSIALVLLATLIFQRLDQAIEKWVAALGAGFLFAALAHGCWWNTTIYDALALEFGRFAPIPIAFTAYSLLMAIATASFVRFAAQRRDEKVLSEISRSFSFCAMAAAVAAWISSIPLIAFQRGSATGIAIALVLSWLLLAWSRKARAESIGFAFSWAIATLIFVAEFGIRLRWYERWTDVQFVLTCMAAVGIWCLPWVGLRRITRNSRVAVLFDAAGFRPEASVAVLLGLIAACLVGFGLVAPVSAEIASRWNVSFCEWARVIENWRWHAVVLGLSSAALAMGCLERVTRIQLESLVLVWFAGWALASIAFEDAVATGTALRWLMAIGGLLLSIIIGCRRAIGGLWSRVAGAIGLQPQLDVTEPQRLAIIQIALTICVVVILGITAVVTAAVMVFQGWGIAGPRANTLFGDLAKDISYAVPIAVLVATCLSYGITQRRQWLAMVGSFVFQSCVVGSLILLLASSDPRIASVRFIQILQFVSIGMTVYGAVWFWQRARIEAVELESQPGSLLQAHTIINASLMLGLTGIVFYKFWVDGQIASDWVKVIGGPVGVVAVAILAPLFIATVPSSRRRFRLWLIAAFGTMAVGVAAIHVDKISSYGVVAIGYGMIFVLAGQIFSKWQNRAHSAAHSVRSFSIAGFAWRMPGADLLPLGLVGLLAQAFCNHAFMSHAPAALIASMLLMALTLIYSFGFLSGNGLLVAYGLAVLNAMTNVKFQKAFGFAFPRSFEIQLIVFALLAVTLAAVAFLIVRCKHSQRMPPRSFSCLPNLAAVLGSVWMSLFVVPILAFDFWSRFDATTTLRIMSLTVLVAITGLQFWNVRAQFVVPTACLCSFAGIAMILNRVDTPDVEMHTVLATAVLVAVWSAIHWHRRGLIDGIQSLRLARPAKLKFKLQQQIPRMVWAFAVPILLISAGSMLLNSSWSIRLEAALMPFALSMAFFYLAGRPIQESRQLVSAMLITMGCLFVSWVDLPPLPNSPTPYVLRALTILAGAVFLFGWLVPSLVRRGDSWLATLRRMTMLTTSLAIGALAFVLVDRIPTSIAVQNQYVISTADAGTALLAVIAMVSGLVAIAVRPKHDAFSFSMPLRLGLVYAAQLVTVLAIVFACTTIPWLFQFGLQHYWPYLLMAASIVGILIAKLLERRDLTVLAQPLMNLALVIPLAGSAGSMLTSTKTEASLVMLMAGSVYWIVSIVQRSTLAGIAALVFGNWALYCYYDKIPQFRFAEHPQLWLIPPALSVLIAAQFNRHRMRRTDLALMRYGALGTMYASSTSEIFIQGMGEQLWPPVVLALLSLGGIFAGILIQVRAFLFVGSLFLLTSMVAMVSHAHRRFEHVWPWWAFGICSGIVILILFGLFEKRRNDLRRVAMRLQTWDL